MRIRGFPRLAACCAALTTLAAIAGSADAKERTAGCAGFPRAFLRIEAAIGIGVGIWNRGNQLATYAIYRDVTQQILADLVSDRSCGPLREVLTQAVERARKAHTPGTAGWDLRVGFDTFMDYVAKGDASKIYPQRQVERLVAPYYEQGCDDLFTYVRRAERALADGRAEAEARAVLAEIKQNGSGCPRVASALQAAIKAKQPEAALLRLAAGQPPPGDPGAPAAILDRCTLLPSLVEELTFAIARGAPRFDDGHPDLCLGIYRETAQKLVERYGRGGRCMEATRLLRKGLGEAQRQADAPKAAWALRNAFDTIGEGYKRAIQSP